MYILSLVQAAAAAVVGMGQPVYKSNSEKEIFYIKFILKCHAFLQFKQQQ